MKKYLIILLLFLSFGCTKKTKNFEDYLEKLESANSYTINTVIEDKSTDETLIYQISYKFDKKSNQRELERIYKNDEKEIFTMYSFTIKEENKYFTYFKTPETKDTSSYIKAEEKIENFNILKEKIVKILRENKNIKENSNKENKIFEVEIDKLDVFEESNRIEYNDGKIIAKVYIKKSNIYKIEL